MDFLAVEVAEIPDAVDAGVRAFSHGHWKTTPMISSMRLDGSSACMTIAGASDTLVFREYVRQVLCPSLRPGDGVIMDHLMPHKSIETLALFAAAGASVRFLPAYSPDLNPT